ncbi:MAG: response regulator transcription factor [Chitinispirillaceae bacterium]|nr:response regulator transcription factor [Chitinispirillaceae bacterium]
MGYRTLIVDDEPAASDRLLRMLSQINAPCDIIGNALNGYDALMMINRSKPDIVFLDIELPGIKGIELLRHCTCDPYIVFTTAYDDYAIEAFESNAISYLVKPFSEKNLIAAINKLIKITCIPANKYSTLLQPLSSELQTAPLSLLPVKYGDSILLLKKELIIWIRAEGRYTVIMTKEKQYVSNYSITELAERLNSPHFIRIHRSYIVNLKHVTELRKIGIGKFKIITDSVDTEEMVVSKNYYEELKKRLDID